jgi:molecular chaperone GrpE (heat shock protein)
MRWLTRRGGTAVEPALDPVTGPEPAADPDSVPAAEPKPVADESPAEPAPLPSEPDRLADAVAALAARQDGLNQLFEDRLRSDAVQAEALRHLHDELRAYRDNFVRQALLPVLKDVMLCFDYASDELERAPAEAPALSHLREVLADLLFKYDVEPVRAAGDEFDPQTQHCVRAVPTADPARERKVAARGRAGFRDRAGLLRKEHVTVFKFTPTGE